MRKRIHGLLYDTDTAKKLAEFNPAPYYDCCIDTTKLIVPSNRQSIVQKIEHILNQTWQYDGTSGC